MKRFTENFFTISVLLAPVLAVYNFLPGISFGSFVVLVFAFLYLYAHGLSSYSKDNLLLFAVISSLTFVEAVINLFSSSFWFDFTLMFHNLFSIFLCFFPLIIASKGVNVKLLINGLLLLGLFASIIIIWQRITLILTGAFEVNVFLPWFEVRREIEFFSITRPSAFFTEPAHFCIFMLPIFYLALLCRKYFYSGLFFFAILCSGSTTGFLVSIIIVAYFVFQNSDRKDRVRNVSIIILGCAILVFTIFTYFPSIILENLDKLREADSSSKSLRTEGYLSYIQYYGISELLFGITLNQLVNFVHYNLNISNVYNYSNAIIYMLLSYGILGFLYFMKYLYRLWSRASSSKGFLIVFFAILASDQILFNMHFFYLATIAMMSNQITSCIDKKTNKSQYLPFF